MKKFIVAIIAILIATMFVSCGNCPYREKDVEKQIEKAVSLDISSDLLIPSSLKITEISYVSIDTLYLADNDYFEHSIGLKVANEMLSNAKTNSEKRTYKTIVDSHLNGIDNVIKTYYSPKQLTEEVYEEPIRAYFVSVDYKCKNAFGVEIENTRYYNVVQWKSSVKQSNGSVNYAFSCKARETDIKAKPIQAIKNDIKFI